MRNNDSNKYIKNVSAFVGGYSVGTNKPMQHNDRKNHGMLGRTAMFDSTRACLSTDYVEAEVQGLTENFYEWTNTAIRLSDISTASNAKKVDDYKQVLIPDIEVDYFPIGAKIKTMGNTWLCVNPSNISSAKTTAIVARCNASYNSYDYYGNVVTEPIVVEKYTMATNDNDHKTNIVLMDGSFNVTCQLNGNTEQLKENSRIILGKKPYHITGLVDFIQEFSGDRNSCHLLTFTARVEEPTESDDITENFIAGGNEQEFDCAFDCIVQNVDEMTVGQTIPILAHFVKNDEIVESTEEYPIDWEWKSSDESVATVDKNGNVTAVGVGVVKITAEMVQNRTINTTAELVIVAERKINNKVVFTSVLPKFIVQNEKKIIRAAFEENGGATDNPLEWSFSGVEKDNYSVSIAKNKKSATITCISPSDKPLNVTVSYNGLSVTANIELLGY